MYDNGENLVNLVTLIGHVASDVALGEAGSGTGAAGVGPPVAFLLSVERAAGEGVDVVRVVLEGDQAAVCRRSLARGLRVAVDGHVRSREWRDRHGRRRLVVDVVADRLQCLWPVEAPSAAVTAGREVAVA